MTCAEEGPDPTPVELIGEHLAGRLTKDGVLATLTALPWPGDVPPGEDAGLKRELEAGRIPPELYEKAVSALNFSPLALAREYKERVARGEAVTLPNPIDWAVERMNLRATWTAENPDRPLDAELAADAELRGRMLHSPELGWATIVLCVADGLAAIDPDALLVHRSTLRYRLGRIREVSGCDIADPESRLNLHVAIRARAALQGNLRWSLTGDPRQTLAERIAREPPQSQS